MSSKESKLRQRPNAAGSAKKSADTVSSPKKVPLNSWVQPVYFAVACAFAAGLAIYATWGPIATMTPKPSTSNSEFLIPSAHEAQFKADFPKREAIKQAFQHAWSEYETHAFGADEYHPISKKGSNMTKAGGIGYTIVDSIDTMMLMGLDEEYARAHSWIQNDLSFDRDGLYNTFEVTIRVLGGLLSAYHLSSANGAPDSIFLEKAEDLGNRLLGAFNTPSGLPLSQINLANLTGISSKDNDGMVSTAEVATLQLELKYLSHLTDDEVYWRAAEKVMATIKGAMQGGLVTVFMEPNAGRFLTSDIRLGSRGDSYYEYLLKQYLQTDRSESVYRDMYDTAMSEIDKHLIKETPTNKLMYTIEIIPSMTGEDGRSIQWRLVPKQDHLVCFLGGSLLLGVTEGRGPIPPDPSSFTESEWRDWKNGVGLIKTCMATHETLTGLAPEIAHFRTPTDPEWVDEAAPIDWYIKGMEGHEGDTYDARYMLRPETVESLFIAHRLTGHPQYRKWGWQIFQAIEKHCKLETGGYATVLNVDWEVIKHDDKMETFFMSETLKYLYLLFDDASKLSLSDVVFNTEAHIFPVFTPSIKTGFA